MGDPDGILGFRALWNIFLHILLKCSIYSKKCTSVLMTFWPLITVISNTYSKDKIDQRS